MPNIGRNTYEFSHTHLCTYIHTQCSRLPAVRSFISQLQTTRYMIIGPGCSTGALPIAEISPFWNLTQVTKLLLFWLPPSHCSTLPPTLSLSLSPNPSLLPPPGKTRLQKTYLYCIVLNFQGSKVLWIAMFEAFVEIICTHCTHNKTGPTVSIVRWIVQECDCIQHLVLNDHMFTFIQI